MIAGISVLAWLALGYALVLLAVAYGVDTMARRSSEKVQRQREGDFSYHEDHDAWLCPEDQWLWPQSFDPDNRVMRYRASPSICNACPVKDTCTASDHGREVSRAVDSWPASEAARFHRGIACAITVLAVAWPLAMALSRLQHGAEVVLLVVGALFVGLAALPLWSHLRRTPADPGGVLVRTLDETVAEQEALAATPRGRRTAYGSDLSATYSSPTEEGEDVR